MESETIRLTRSAATLMACPEPLGDAEKELARALEQAKRWRIHANTLEFLDEAGVTVALFEAVDL